MFSNFTPPNYIKLPEFLASLRSIYFHNPDKLSFFLKQNERSKFIERGTLLNPDYKEQQEKERAKYLSEHNGSGWVKTNLPQPRYQEHDLTIYKIYEINASEEDYLINCLKNPDEKNLTIPLRQITISILDQSLVTPSDPLAISVQYRRAKKAATSIDEFKNLLSSYLIDKKIKERLRIQLCNNSYKNVSGTFCDKFSSWALADKTLVMIPKQTWISDDFWYVSLSTGIVSFVWKSYNDWTGEEEDSYPVRNQLAFLEKSAVDNYISSLQEVKDEKPLYSGEDKTLDDSVEKKILIFVKTKINNE